MSLATLLAITYRESRAEFRGQQARLTERFEREVAPFDASYRLRLERVEKILQSADAPYAGDALAPSLRKKGQLDAVLEGPLVYVRGPLRGFRRASERRSTWGTEGPDGFIRCVIQPPPDAKESTLLRHLGEIYRPQAFRDRFVNLDPAFAALDFIDSPFRERLRTASLMRDLKSLGVRLDEAKLGPPARFGRVRVFVYVFDEPKVVGTASDFDGEAEHYMRVGIIDLDNGEHLLRVRRLVSPEWISEKSRLMYSRQLDSCRLAHELREELVRPGPSNTD